MVNYQKKTKKENQQQQQKKKTEARNEFRSWSVNFAETLLGLFGIESSKIAIFKT